MPRVTNAQSHFVPLPDQAEFQAHVQEFYWCAGNMVKGLARQNLVYANEQLNRFVRPELFVLLAATYQQTSLAETKMSLLNILAFYRVVSEQLSRDQEMMRPIMITKIYQQFNDWLSV